MTSLFDYHEFRVCPKNQAGFCLSVPLVVTVGSSHSLMPAFNQEHA